MATYKYRPDYGFLYSKEKLAGECLTKEVLTALRKSDRKMEYQEYDLRTERIRIRQSERTVKLISCRESSLDRMLELGDEFAASEMPSPYWPLPFAVLLQKSERKRNERYRLAQSIVR